MRRESTKLKYKKTWVSKMGIKRKKKIKWIRKKRPQSKMSNKPSAKNFCCPIQGKEREENFWLLISLKHQGGAGFLRS